MAKQQPAVPPRKSVFPDYIICLEDGKKLKMLKRHLQTSYGLTPAQYREKWGCRTTTRWWRRPTPRSARRSPDRSASAGSRLPPRPLFQILFRRLFQPLFWHRGRLVGRARPLLA